MRDIQVIIVSSDDTVLRVPGQDLPGMRSLGSKDVGRLVSLSGIVISASPVRARATHLTLQCRNCRETRTLPLAQGLGGLQLPRVCSRPQQQGEDKCPLDPYLILADKSHCVDQQTLKLQELPEDVPTGEMPRHMLLAIDRYDNP